MNRAKPAWDANSLLSGGLLALLLIGYIALCYAATVMAALLLVPSDGPVRGQSPFVTSIPWWLSASAFALFAFTILPVGRWLRDHVNALVFSEHDDPYALIARVNQALQGMASPQGTLPVVAETVAQTLHLPYLAIETTHTEPAWHCAVGSALAGAEVIDVPIAYLDRTLGTLRASARGERQPLSAGDVMLLRDVARQLGIALRAAQLSADVQSARERLVLAREEERRRIRNDLHDGLAPTLSSLQLRLGAVRRLIRQDPAQAETLAGELGDDLRIATGAIRQLVYELRPPMLDELQLVGALRSMRFTGSDVHFEVQAPEPMPALPAAVEAAVYRIATEAMHNVVKHAGAANCLVRIEASNGRLALTVSDDGAGTPGELAAGIGIRSMRDRAEELGGTLSVERGAEGGTRVTALIPINL